MTSLVLTMPLLRHSMDHRALPVLLSLIKVGFLKRVACSFPDLDLLLATVEAIWGVWAPAVYARDFLHLVSFSASKKT